VPIKTVESELPGIFYRTIAPNTPPLVKENDRVTEATQIGVLEIMKNFTPILAGVSGTIVKFLVAHEEEIVPGTPICEIETN
jgi:acetyl-CoA carboxylase biotin carboxyl carrier protein